jgi:hypothetical protein
MPFTISHAAVVLPFRRWLGHWRLLSATVIGSMVPDFGLFWPGRLPRVETHSAAGLFTFSLPVGLATYWLFQLLVKTPALELLPNGAYARSRRFAAPALITDPRQWCVAAAGVFVGAFSHLVLDGFTHTNGRGVRLLPVLDDPVVDIHGHWMSGYVAMQNGISLLGLAIVVIVVWRDLRTPAEAGYRPARWLAAPERSLWVLGYALAAAGLTLLALFPRHTASPLHAALMIGNLAVACMRGCACALLLCAASLQLRLRAVRRL